MIDKGHGGSGVVGWVGARPHPAACSTSDLAVVGASRPGDQASRSTRKSVQSREARAMGRAGKRMGRRTTVAGQRLAGATVGTGQTTGKSSGNRSGLLRKNEPYMVRLCVGEPPNVRYYGTLVLRVFLWTSPPHFERMEKHRKEFCHRPTIL